MKFSKYDLIMLNSVVRTQYLDTLLKLKDTELIKVITGVRRCGKSTLLSQLHEKIAKDEPQANTIFLNFEDYANQHLRDGNLLHDHILTHAGDKPTYVFLDEVQLVSDFPRVLSSLLLRPHIDLYVTGSNAALLSGELATALTGRYIETHILPLSFLEYSHLVEKEDDEVLDNFLTHGSFPYAARLDDEQIRDEYLSGIYNTVLLKDIVAHTQVRDVKTLENLARFLAHNIGSIVSPKKIADTLTSSGVKTTSITISQYLKALENAYIFYPVSRYDVKGKELLKTMEKFYIVDPGLRSFLIGRQHSDIGHVIENVVFLELVRRGWTVRIGKIGKYEIDFVATRPHGVTHYVQATMSMNDSQVVERELRPLRMVGDAYPKTVISLDAMTGDFDGIRHVNLRNFLLSPDADF